MAMKKTGLGRGLSSLFDDTTLVQNPAPVTKPKDDKKEKYDSESSAAKDTKKAPKSAKPVQSEAQDTGLPLSEAVVYIKLSDVKPNSAQPRKAFDEESLADLAASIKENGVIQPVIVRPAKKGYELVAGERRWRAARLAGLKEIPALVRELDEQANAVYALIENMQREDLNPIEEAQGVKLIMEKYGFTQEETAKMVGKSRPYIANSLRLLTLPEKVREYIVSGKLSMGHAKAIAGLSGEELQIEAADKAVKEGWSVRQIENYTKSKPKKKPLQTRKSIKKDPETVALEERLAEALGTRVEILGTPKKGMISVSYFSQDELDRLVELFEK